MYVLNIFKFLINWINSLMASKSQLPGSLILNFVKKSASPFYKYGWLRQWKDLTYGLLFSLSFFLVLDRGQVLAQAQNQIPSSGCAGWLCGPKTNLINSFPDGSPLITGAFVLVNGIVLAVLIGIAITAINRYLGKEDFGVPLIMFFGILLVLFLVNGIAGYIFGDTGTTVAVPV